MDTVQVVRPAEDCPHSVDAELALLATLIQRNNVFDRIDFLLPEHFAYEAHARIYAAIAARLGRGRPVDQITLRDELVAEGALEEVGGWRYIVGLSNSVVSLINGEDYARTIYEMAQRRRLIDLMAEVGTLARSAPPEEAVEAIERGLSEITATARTTEPQPLSHGVRLWLAEVEETFKAGGRPSGMSTGLRAMDAMLGGLKPGRLYVLAGRPSIGKSTLARTIAYQSIRRGTGVGYFALEEGQTEVVAGLAAGIACVDTFRQENGVITEQEWERLVEAGDELSRLPLYVDETPKLSVAQIRLRAKKLKRQHKIGLVIADHIGLADAADTRTGRVEQLGQITYDLKAMAKELAIPVLALCQLSRAIESRDDKRPTLADLRESGRIEENADAVIFIYREQYYLERAEPQRREGENDERFANRTADWQQRLSECRNKADLIFPKVRQGKTGASRLAFMPAESRFYDLQVTP